MKEEEGGSKNHGRDGRNRGAPGRSGRFVWRRFVYIVKSNYFLWFKRLGLEKGLLADKKNACSL